MIENRQYLEDSTPTEIDAIKERVKMHSENIIYAHDLPKQTIFSADIFFDEIERLVKEEGKFALAINLSDAGKPDPKTKKHIKERFKQLKDKVMHCAFFTRKRPALNSASLFSRYGTGFNSYSISSSEREALKSIENAFEQL